MCRFLDGAVEDESIDLIEDANGRSDKYKGKACTEMTYARSNKVAIYNDVILWYALGKELKSQAETLSKIESYRHINTGVAASREMHIILEAFPWHEFRKPPCTETKENNCSSSCLEIFGAASERGEFTLEQVELLKKDSSICSPELRSLVSRVSNNMSVGFTIVAFAKEVVREVMKK